MRRLIGLCFCLISIKFCFSQEIIKLRINPDDAMGANVSDLFDSVRYIPLITSEKDPVGSIQNMQVSSTVIVFWDMDNKCIRIFNKQGTQLGTIKASSNKNIKWHWLYWFSFNPYNNTIYSKDGKFIYAFDITGNLIDKIVMADSMNNYDMKMYFLDSSHCLMTGIPKLGASSYYVTEFTDFKKPLKSYFPIDTSDIFIRRQLFNYSLANLNSYDRRPVWFRMGDYNLLNFDSKEAPVTYKFIFPEAISVEKHMIDSVNSKKNSMEWIDLFAKNRSWINSLSNIRIFKEIIFFEAQKGNSTDIDDQYMYSIPTSQLYNLGRISPDKRSYLLPIASMNWGPIADGKMYTDISAWELFAQVNEHKDNTEWKNDSTLRTFIENGSRKSNPVIVELKLKDNL